VGTRPTDAAPGRDDASPAPASPDAEITGAGALVDATALPLASPDRYELEGELARGGQGLVLRAFDRHLRRDVVLKQALRASPDALARFVRETFVTARLEHPAVVPVHDAGRWPSGEPFYVMKRVSGRSLDEEIRERKTLSARLALLPNVLAVAEAVAYAHSQRVIHRDLKPANVLVGTFGETVVVDWGLAKDLASEHPEPVEIAGEEERVGGKTAVGDIIGTPAYMPPEQAEGLAIDERADVYALGALLYHLIAGAAPYSRRERKSRHVLEGPPEPVAVLEPDAPPDLLAVVDKAMARRAADRYANAGELAEELRRFLTGRLVGAHRYSLRELVVRWVRRNRTAVLVGALLAALLVVLAIASFIRIVRERDAADAARRLAEDARRALAARNDALVLMQARAQLDSDPTASLAWIKTYPRTGPDWKAASDIAADAWTRGVARHVFRGPEPFTSVVFSPDGKLVAAGSGEKGVRVWDVASGHARWLESDVAAAGPLVFTPDGARLVGADGQEAVRVWDLATGARRACDGVMSGRLAVSSDGARVLGTSRSIAGAFVCDLATGSVKKVATGAGDAERAAWMPDGRGVAAIAANALWVVDVVTGALDKVGEVGAGARGIAVSDDGRWIVAGVPARQSLVVFDRRRANGRRELRTEGFLTWSAHFAPDGVLYSAGTSPGLLRWNLETGESQATPWHEVVNAWSFAAHRVVAAGRDDQLMTWVGESAEGTRLPGHSATIAAVDVTADGAWAASASSDRTVRVWRLGEGEIAGFPGLGSPGFPSRDGTRVLTSVSPNWEAAIVDVATGAVTKLTGPRMPWIWSASGAWQPDGAAVLVSDPDQRIGLVELASGAHRDLGRYGAPGTLDLAESFSPDGRLVAMVPNDGTVKLVTVATGEIRTVGRHEAQAVAVDFAPSGASFATAGRDAVVKIWDVATGAARVFAGHAGTVMDVQYSQDGKLLASTGDDATVRVWNVETGEARVLRGHTAAVDTADFAPDGRTLVSGSSDRTLRIWDLATGESRVLRRFPGPVWAVDYARDGRYVAVVTDATGLTLIDPHATPALEEDPGRLLEWIGRETTAEVNREGVIATP
jgi:eukaryotic-like serine/threonine-protein kinase